MSVTILYGTLDAVAIAQPEEIDPYDLMEPVNILDKMPKDFYDRIVSNTVPQ